MRLLLILALAGCGGSTQADAPSGAADTGTTPSDTNVADTPPTTTPCAELAGFWLSGNAQKMGDRWDVSGCVARPGPAFETVKPATRAPDRWATARCNDGTPFAFVVRLASPPSKQWVIYLEGGGYCDEVSMSCATRDRELTTTIPEADRAPTSRAPGGVMSRDPAVNPAFAKANHVFLHYCSSDFWSGSTTEKRSSFNWYFSGHTNVRAMLELLVERYGLEDGAAEVLFGGGSAGAFGAHFNVNLVEKALPKTAAAKKLRLLVDAGWMIEWDDPAYRLGKSTLIDIEAWRAARNVWGGTFDPACEGAEKDPMKCFFGPGWYAYLSKRMPVLIQQSTRDSVFMGVHGLTATDATAATWQTQVEASLKDVGWLFSSARSYHVLAGSDAAMKLGPAGSTLAQVLDRFFRDGAPERVLF
jgi:hypothetical protein